MRSREREVETREGNEWEEGKGGEGVEEGRKGEGRKPCECESLAPFYYK